MKTTFIISLLLSSCVGYENLAYTSKGNFERTRIVSLGGSTSHEGANGSSFTSDHNKSFADASQAVSAITATIGLTSVNKAKEVTKQTSNFNAAKTAQAKISADAAAAQAATAAKTETTKTAINAGAPLGTVNVNPP